MVEQRRKDLPIDRGWAWVITFGKIKMNQFYRFYVGPRNKFQQYKTLMLSGNIAGYTLYCNLTKFQSFLAIAFVHFPPLHHTNAVEQNYCTVCSFYELPMAIQSSKDHKWPEAGKTKFPLPNFLCNVRKCVATSVRQLHSYGQLPILKIKTNW